MPAIPRTWPISRVIRVYVFAHGDIGDPVQVARLLSEHQIDAIVNFAAESHVDRSIDSPEPFVQTNVVGTLRLLNSARLHWAKLPEPGKTVFRFLHVSSRRSLRHARAGRSRFHGRHAVCAEQSLRGFQGGERPPRASLPAYLWAADTHDELLEQLRPLSFCRRNSFPW